MNIHAIIETRVNSKRFYGKVLKKFFNNKTINDILYSRLKKSPYINKIIFATGKSYHNDKLIRFLKKKKYNFFIGSEKNVLDRTFKCATENQTDLIVRITGDNPFLDIKILDKMIKFYLKKFNYIDYLSNNGTANLKKKRNLPYGLDIQIYKYISFKKIFLISKKIKKKNNMISSPPMLFYASKNKFKNYDFVVKKKWNKRDLNFDLTIDYPEQFDKLNMIYKYFKGSYFSCDDIFKNIKNIF